MAFISKSLIVAALWLLGAAAAAVAAPYPDHAIRWIVPYPPGGGSDAMARVVAQAVQATLGQPVVIDNKPGAATNIGVAALLQAQPDGYTLMQAQDAALVYNEHLFKKLPYRPERDFSYIGAIARLPLVWVVDAALPIRTLDEFMRYMAAHPEAANYALPGLGTPHHIAMALLMQRTGLRLTAVPFQGGAPALQSVMAGQVPTMMLDLAAGLSFIKAGKVRALAVASAQRARALPELPTFDELGVAGVSVDALQALIGPAGLSDDTVKRLNAALNLALQQPTVAKFLAETGAEALPGTPADLRRYTRAESARWGSVLRSLDLQLD